MPKHDNITPPSIQKFIQDQIEVSQRHLLLPTSFVANIVVSNPIVSVKNVTRLHLKNTAPQDITYFKEGQEGQEIIVLGDGQTTLIFNITKIITNTLADKLLNDGYIYKLYMFDNIWYEQ